MVAEMQRLENAARLAMGEFQLSELAPRKPDRLVPVHIRVGVVIAVALAAIAIAMSLV